MIVLQLKGYKTSNHFPNMFMFLEVRQCLDADSVYITKYKTYDVINWCVLYSSVYLLVIRTWAGKTDAVEGHMIAIVWIVSEYVLYYTEETSFCRRHRFVVGIKIWVIGSYPDNTRGVPRSKVKEAKRWLLWANTSSFTQYAFGWNSKLSR